MKKILERHPQGHETGFSNPTTGDKVIGKIIDEVWYPEPESFGEFVPADGREGWLETAFVAQLIDWSGERRVRFTYYTRRSGDGWVFGQFSASMGTEELKHLLKGIAEKKWLVNP